MIDGARVQVRRDEIPGARGKRKKEKEKTPLFLVFLGALDPGSRLKTDRP